MSGRLETIALVSLASVSFSACGGEGAESSGTTSQSLDSCAPLDVARSLFVTDDAALAKFPFQRVMDQIVRTGPPSSGQTGLTLYRQMLDTLNDRAHGVTSGPHCDDQIVNGKPSINGFPITCPRLESKLSATNPFGTDKDGYRPVALVNRFDLAPQSGANCGQHRIVFGKNSGLEDQLDRLLFIFEATLPNPNPNAGIAGCRPIAKFWADLSSDADAASRAAKLENFYFMGLPGFPPVIHARHYGIGGGQIRANMFVNEVPGSFQQWELREFHLMDACAGEPRQCKLVARNVAVQVNPFGGLFGAGSSADFQTAFLGQVASLASRDVNTIAMTSGARFNAGQSAQQDTSNDYLVQAQNNTAFHNAISAKLAEIGRTDLTSNDILQRATTQSCAGCHQLSPNDNLGGGLTWPASHTFTHVTEARRLSPALTDVFLPFRAGVLTRFLCGGDAGVAVTAEGDRTIGGGFVGAAN